MVPDVVAGIFPFPLSSTVAALDSFIDDFPLVKEADSLFPVLFRRDGPPRRMLCVQFSTPLPEEE